MKSRLAAVLLAVAVGLSARVVAVAQNAAPGDAASSAPARPAGSLTILDFKPAMTT
jgi:hypothetical protein